MSETSRKTARRNLFELLFETEFKRDISAEEIYSAAIEDRGLQDDDYVRGGFFGICEKSATLDAIIGKYARGWRTDRLSKVSRTIIRLSVYEMLYTDIPSSVSVSEAVDMAKKYGEDKARAFVNGVLASIVKDIDANGREAIISSVCPADNDEESTGVEN